MLILSNTTHILELETSSAASTDFYVAYADHSASAFTPGNQFGNVAAAQTTTILAAPGSSVQRQVKNVSIVNRGSVVQTVKVKLDVSGTEYALTPWSVTLQPGWALLYSPDVGWRVFDAAGRPTTSSAVSVGNTGRAVGFYKIGSVAEAVGRYHFIGQTGGNPGAWSPGTPGVAGRATNGTQSADGGALPIGTPAGSHFLTNIVAATSQTMFLTLIDILWVNSGLSVTTTTAQTVNSVTLPARDLDGTTNGHGIEIGLLITTATTQGSPVTTGTISYTNSDGTSGRTGTIEAIPATAVAGTICRVSLAAGDKGVRSIQSVTLGTTLTAGAISLIMYRHVASQPNAAINVGSQRNIDPNPGVRLFNGSCLLFAGIVTTTTAALLMGHIDVADR